MNERLEQLEARLREWSPEDTSSRERVDLLLELAEEHFSGDDPQRLIELTNEALEISRNLDYSKGKAYGLWYESLGCCFTADHAKGLARVDESQTRLEEMGDSLGIAKALMLKANILRSIGDFDQALPPMYESLEYFREAGHSYWEANTYYSLGLLYHEIKDFPQALENHQKTIDAMEGRSEQWLVARALNGVGQALNSMGKGQEALDSHHRSLALFREIGHAMGEARVLDDIGSIYMEMGDDELALPFHVKSLETRRTIGQRRAQCTSLLNIARIQVRQKNDAAAIATLDEAFAIAQETGSKPHVYDAHRLYSEAYELQEDFAQALHHCREFQRTREEVFNEDATDRIKKLQIGFQVQKAEQDAELAHFKNVELREKNDKLEVLLQELRDTQTQLVQSEKMAALGKMVAGMVHEMNTPIGASSSAIDVTERCIRKITDLQRSVTGNGDQAEAAKLDFLLNSLKKNQQINREANQRITSILGNLKRFISLDGGQREEVDIHEGLESALSLLANDIDDRITIVRRYGDLGRVECCPGEINQVFMSLLTNAAEAIEGSGTITVTTSAEDGEFRIAITDTGSGMTPEVQNHLFEPAFSTKGARVKAGMSLMVGLNIVQKHGGRIEVESEVGRGSTFTVIGPCPGSG
jgi:signal transduction histidine kinase